jgi:membrane-bound inhibitor of C-type lysozyme
MHSRSAWLLPCLLTAVFSNILVGSRTAKPAASSHPTSSDEFVGPFSSWTNVKTAYGAAGDGVADDTAPVQKALTEVGTNEHSPVLYFPAGTYRITATLNLAHAIDVSLIGQDPSLTSIVWGGVANGTMLHVNGVAYSKFSRLTFDGSSTALIAVDQSRASNQSNYFDTGNEYSDDVFRNAGYGIRGGAQDGGFAETSVERSHFIGNWVAGIATMNFNALDLWVWYSTFQDCGMGITNRIPGSRGAGNYHVYYCNFRNSTKGDLVAGNTGGFSARGNFSSGSAWFWAGGGGTNNPANIDIIGNTILDPTNTAISVQNQGPVLLMNNVIRTLAGNPGPAVSWTTFSNDQDVESIDNTFTTNDKVFAGKGELIEFGDQVVPYASVKAAAPTLPGTLPNMNRKVFEVASGSSASVIQSAINLAVAENGRRPVVHIPYGRYNIDRTIVIPPSDIQIAGDGYGIGNVGTVLHWTGGGAGPLLQVDGPSKATLRDIGISAGTATGILVNNIDQPGSRVYMDQTQLHQCQQSCLVVGGIDNASVDLENVCIEGLTVVTGGARSSSGASTPGSVNIFSGSGGSQNSATAFDVSQGGKLLIRDYWSDSGDGRSASIFASIHGRATFTADGDEIFQSGAGTPSISVNNLSGAVTILTSNLGASAGVSVSGNGSKSAVLGMGVLMFYSTSTYFTDTTSPPGAAAMLNVRQHSRIPTTATSPVPDIGSINPSFITTMLAQAVSQNPAVLSALPPAASDVRFFRVAVSDSANGISIQGRALAPR